MDKRNDAQLDHEEMVHLLASVQSSRLSRELQPWLASKADEMKLSAGGACSRALEDADLDHEEMTKLVSQCSSRRLKQELQPWLARKAEELKKPSLVGASDASVEAELDHEEMSQLVARCRSSRLRRELQPWLARQFEATRISSTYCASLPTILIVGAPGVGKRRLMWSLAGKTSDTFEPSAGEAEVGIVTKYYRARARCCVVDIGDDASVDNVQQLLRIAHAVVLVWSDSQSMSFNCIRDYFTAREDGRGGECFGWQRVQISVGVRASPAEDRSPVVSEAALWSLDNGFEHLYCSLEDADLDALRSRMLGEAKKQRASLLHSDNEDTILRVADAIECHAWPTCASPSSVSREARTDAPAVTSQPQKDSSGAALVVVVGVSGVGHRDLAQALTGSELDSRGCAEVALKTKYYHRRLRFQAIDLDVKKDDKEESANAPVESSSTLSLLKAAEGVLLVCDVLRPETFTRVQQLYDTACPMPCEENCEEFGEGIEAVQLCLAIDNSDSPNEEDEEDNARVWCADHFFEYLRCPLRDDDLKRARKRWSSGGRNASLLSMDDDDGIERIVEALECHTWKDIDLEDESAIPDDLDAAEKCAPDNDTKAAEAENGSAKHGPDKEDLGTEQAVEMMEYFTEEIKKVRDMPDDAHRRDRAAEIALRVAKSWGLDSDDDDDT